MTGPFAALGLPDSPVPGDDDVRSAWRRIAEATHPDRSDGGDPAGFAAAAAAYAQLRTPSGRGEAVAGRADRGRRAAGWTGRGSPLRLALRLLAATGASAVAVLAIGWQPASVAIIAGALTFLIRTGRHDAG